MKFPSKNIWNIDRKGKKYWLSLVFILIPCLFQYSLFNGPLLSIYQYIKIKTNFFDYDFIFFDRNLLVLRLLNYVFLILFVTFLIMILESCFSFKMKNKHISPKFLYSFIFCWQFIIDVIVLIILFIINLIVIYQNKNICSPDSVTFVFFLISLSVGVIMNFSCIFPWRDYKRIKKSLEEQNNIFQEAWLCIPTHAKISTFSLLPGECEEMPVVITDQELSIINKRRKNKIEGRDFNKLLVYIDGITDKENFQNIIEKYSSYLHMRCLVISKGKTQNSQYETEINTLKNWMNAQIMSSHQNIYSLNTLDKYLGFKYTYKVVKCLKEGNSLQNMGKILDNTYLNIIHGPKISLDFFRICLTEPNLSKAIFQFFDYIDLQYRLVCAFFAPENLNWHVKKSDTIGNYKHMFRFLAGNLKELTTKSRIVTKYIFEDDMWNVLEKYLPNQSKSLQGSQSLTSEEINVLCAELRNKIRAHQNLKSADIAIMLNLVFRLALSTNYMLEINQLSIECNQNDSIIGKYKNIVNKSLSPFLKPIKGHCWIFNNAKKKEDAIQMEYVNFLTGKLIQVTVQWSA